MNQTELRELIKSVVQETLCQLGYTVDGTRSKGDICTPPNVDAAPSKGGMSAYEKTEALLFSYCAFKRIVGERVQEVEDIKRYGVPKVTTFEYVPHTASKGGIVLPEVSVEVAVQKVLEQIRGTVGAIALVDRGLAALQNDPYYQILPMRYFEGRTQEDIAYELGCAQKTISQNKCRLIRELAMQIFPGQVADEMMS